MSASKKIHGFSEESAEFSHHQPANRTRSIGPVRATVGEGGRLVIPAEMRKVMGIKTGDTLILKVTDDELTAVSQLVSIRKVQKRLAPYKRPGENAVDEFLADRKDEQRRSDARFDRLHDEGIATKKP
ncbi:AbrB/MazE/SpoVT family DNA-binding domain-containing protein [Mesorhizobium sp. KR9-304]|uniref:AbrB/MazE/SpoVT family DNA-binding domain-containing protein n=1 Tax=Mesorhizobium sp. KR9-304 TaxID=3156614 RepID=UPI0032B527FF